MPYARNSLKATLLSMICTASITSPLYAAIITFDDLADAAVNSQYNGSTNTLPLNHYAGLNWSGIAAQSLSGYIPANSGYPYPGAGSAANAFTFSDARLEHQTPTISSLNGSVFDFSGGEFSTAWLENANLTLSGFKPGNVTATPDYTWSEDINRQGSTTVNGFLMSGINRLVFSLSSTDPQSPQVNAQGSNIVMDNLDITMVDAPGTLGLLTTGLIGYGLITSRRRRNNSLEGESLGIS